MELTVGEIQTEGTRKKLKQPSKREMARRKRYCDPNPNCEGLPVICTHKKGPFICNSLTAQDVKVAKRRVYGAQTKVKQDKRIACFLSCQHPKRKIGGKRKAHSLQITYKLPKGNKKITVCRAAFQKNLGIKSVRRIVTIGKHVIKGMLVQEYRGGDRRSAKSKDKKDKVRAFIKSLKGRESHYNRKKSRRVYLDAELNISKLWRMYNNKTANDNEKVKLGMFKNIFVREFNIGFSSPATDTCTTCALQDNKIKNAQTVAVKNKAMLEKRVHKIRAKAFYDMIRQCRSENAKSFCFDLQQVQVLPKLPIQDAFYARQIAHYALCCVDLASQNPTFYCWTETEAGRGSNAVASAVYQHLSELEIGDATILWLFADGCGGQNKNSHVVHMLLFWLLNKSPATLKEIVLVFPVRGHSFLPADRVFGRVEKDLRKHSVVTSKSEYAEIYLEHGKVKAVGQDWDMKNFKAGTNVYKKVVGISEMKRLYLKKVEGRGNGEKSVHFKGDVCYKADDPSLSFVSLLKRGKTHDNFKPASETLHHPLTIEKKKDVKSLLTKYYGDEWCNDVSLAWYKHILQDEPINEGECESEGECDCHEIDIGLRV